MNIIDFKQYERLILDIELYNLQLRRFSDILLVDEQFLLFYDIFGALERKLLELSRINEGRPDVRVVSFLVPLLNKLQEERPICLRQIDEIIESRWDVSVEDLKKKFETRLKANLRRLQQSYKLFRAHVLQRAWRLGDISVIAELEELLVDTDHLAQVLRKNHLNCVCVIKTTDLPGSTECTLELSCLRLKFTINSLVVVSLVRFWTLLDTMDGEESIRALHDQLQREIRRSLVEMQVNEEELESLREKLFPSTVSLATERTVAVERRAVQATELLEQLRDIDALESDKVELEGRVAQLVSQRETIQSQLDDRKRLLQDGVREIVRLERLIEVTEQKIADGIAQFQQQTAELEQRRQELLQDETLSAENRLSLVARCDAELTERANSHTSNIHRLEATRDELLLKSSSLAQDVESFRNEIDKIHQNTVSELEQRKQNVSQEEGEGIEDTIRRERAEHEQNLLLLDRARARSGQSSVEHGTSEDFIAEAGESVAPSVSQEHQLAAADDPSGNVPATIEIMQEDETGRFSLDSSGEKIYHHRQYFTDPQGKYYMDDTGNRIYTTTISDAEGMPQSEAAAQGVTDEPIIPEITEEVTAETEMERDRRKRVASGVAYIESSVGVPLRRALAVVARVKPADPIGYLADFLALLAKTPMDDERRLQLLERLCTVEKKH